MDIVVTGRHAQVTDRFREHLEDKLSKVPQLLPKVSRIDVVVTHEKTARNSESVEITCHAKGPVIRAEACTDDKYASLDAALDKLFERLRRVGDRRRVSRAGRRVPESVALATSRISPEADGSDADGSGDGSGTDGATAFGAVGNSPIEVREKVHASSPMTLEEALAQMELVGHDFYLFHDSDTDRPSVVYRRRGWSYGVIHLQVDSLEAVDSVGSASASADHPMGHSVGQAV
ncbi:MAG: ribosome-associated translation inhibitor RaiA [Lapillicoccus sp.]